MFKSLINNITQIPGWKTRKKIIVFESDDWGSIRMPSNEVKNSLHKSNPNIANDLYCKYDNLENSDDLNALFELLKKYKDKNGRNPVITANTIVANPNFDKIKGSNFENYFYETFLETLNNYYPNQNVFKLYQQGITENIFFPQFHGREHVNVSKWLNELKNNNNLLIEAFNHKVFGIPLNISNNSRGNFMASFDAISQTEIDSLEKNLADGLNLFENIFHYKSKTIICPCYVWPNEINKILAEKGVKAFQGMKFQFEPSKNKTEYSKSFHYTGQKGQFNLRYLVRNVFFEPTHFQQQSHINELISKITTAFKWNNPVIIGTHRINFIGSLQESNRNTNLQKLDEVLNKITSQHPDVEFYTSAELIEEINTSKS
jgi:hypothetical protein